MSKKLIIAISAFALAIIAGVVAVVGVFAAQQQKVANTFTITYTANNVRANVYCYYGYKSDGKVNTGNGIQDFRFEPEESERTETFAPSITLTAEDPGVIFMFEFDNLVSYGGKKLSITLTDTSIKKNVNVYYAVTGATGPQPYSSIAVAENLNAIPDTITIDPLPENGSATSAMAVHVVIEIADPTLDAEYTTTADAGLHFTLNAVD